MTVALAAIFVGACRAAPSPTLSNDPLVVSGKALYETNCQACHGGATGGTMMDLPPKHNANGHTWHHADCVLRDIILNGPGEMGEMMREMMGGSNVPEMPVFKGKLSNEDVAAILAYIKTWWREDQREAQALVTQNVCPLSFTLDYSACEQRSKNTLYRIFPQLRMFPPSTTEFR